MDYVAFKLVLYCRHAVCYVILTHSIANPYSEELNASLSIS